jgi:hypothetical protein
MGLAHDRVILLGADSMQALAGDLNKHLGPVIVTKAGAKPKSSEEDWKGITVTEYAPLYKAFADAAREDMATIL